MASTSRTVLRRRGLTRTTALCAARRRLASTSTPPTTCAVFMTCWGCDSCCRTCNSSLWCARPRQSCGACSVGSTRRTVPMWRGSYRASTARCFGHGTAARRRAPDLSGPSHWTTSRQTLTVWPHACFAMLAMRVQPGGGASSRHAGWLNRWINRCTMWSSSRSSRTLRSSPARNTTFSASVRF